MKIDYFSKEGKHYANEDSLCIRQLSPQQVVAVLADGMDGLNFGKEAADIIVHAVSEFVCENLGRYSIQELFGKALEHTDRIIAQKSKETHSKMGAAMALLYIDDHSLHYTWLGNVRLYLSEQNEGKLLTRDHSLDAGYGKQLLTRCIKGKGIREGWPYHYIELKEENSLVLCTDGLYKNIKLERMFATKFPLDEEFEDDASLIRIEL